MGTDHAENRWIPSLCILVAKGKRNPHSLGFLSGKIESLCALRVDCRQYGLWPETRFWKITPPLSQSVELFEGLGNFARKVFSIEAIVIAQTKSRGFQINQRKRWNSNKRVPLLFG